MNLEKAIGTEYRRYAKPTKFLEEPPLLYIDVNLGKIEERIAIFNEEDVDKVCQEFARKHSNSINRTEWAIKRYAKKFGNNQHKQSYPPNRKKSAIKE